MLKPPEPSLLRASRIAWALPFWPPLAWAGVLFVLSSIPGHADWPAAMASLPHADKLAHAIAYGVLGALLMRALLRRGARSKLASAAMAVAGALAYGVTDEIHQMFVPMRSPDVFDLIADGTGAMLGIVVYLATRRRPKRRLKLMASD